jgi:hypothetical protein
MGIFLSLEASTAVRDFEVIAYREWDSGYYYRVRVSLADGSSLHAREFFDGNQRHYSFHWQTAEGVMIRRWDDAPHYPHLETHPHHVHEDGTVGPSFPMSLEEALGEIEKQLGPPSDEAGGLA